jgi:hypothetical protein
MASNLERIDFPQLGQLRAAMERIDDLMGEARGIDFRIDRLDERIHALFPGEVERMVRVDHHIAKCGHHTPRPSIRRRAAAVGCFCGQNKVLEIRSSTRPWPLRQRKPVQTSPWKSIRDWGRCSEDRFQTCVSSAVPFPRSFRKRRLTRYCL